jgi:hypothetical protein
VQTMHIIRYENRDLLSKARAQLLGMADADCDVGARYICVKQHQLEDLAELGLIPSDELQRLRQIGTLPPSNGEMST